MNREQCLEKVEAFSDLAVSRIGYISGQAYAQLAAAWAIAAQSAPSGLKPQAPSFPVKR